MLDRPRDWASCPRGRTEPLPHASESRPLASFGATGTRYVLTLATELQERGARYGVIGVCIGSGQGVAVVLENPSAG